MAPTRRTKKGMSRRDAALEHMKAYGFSTQIIRKTINDLLKLYGDDGWRFIEENGYKVLVEVILDEQETENTHNLLEGASTSRHGNTGNELVTTVLSDVVSVEALQEASTSQPENTGKELVTTESIQVPFISTPAVVNEEYSKDVPLDNKLIQSSPFCFSDDDLTENKVSIPYTEDLTPSGSVIDMANSSLKVCTRKRKPCNGWIDGNDDDDAEEPSFMSLEPATQSFFQPA